MFELAKLTRKIFYNFFEKFTTKKDEVYFVMMGTSRCCNPRVNPGASKECKSFCGGKLLIKLMNRINSAESSICIAMYNITNLQIVDSVIGANRRGIDIRLLIDKKTCENKDTKAQAERLKNAGKITKIFCFQFFILI